MTARFARYAKQMLDLQASSLRSRVIEAGIRDRMVVTARLAAQFEELSAALRPALTLEIGAHEASFSKRMRAKLPDARVVAFEANPAVHTRYAKTVVGAGVEYVNKAMAETVSQLRFVVPRADSGRPATGGGSLMEVAVAPAGTVELMVDAVPLDAFLGDAADAPNVMWIDVEGAVGRVLQGAERALRACHALYVEVETDHRWSGQIVDVEVVERLLPFGLIPVLRDIQKRNQYNLLFVREDWLAHPEVARALAGFSEAPFPAAQAASDAPQPLAPVTAPTAPGVTLPEVAAAAALWHDGEAERALVAFDGLLARSPADTRVPMALFRVMAADPALHGRARELVHQAAWPPWDADPAVLLAAARHARLFDFDQRDALWRRICDREPHNAEPLGLALAEAVAARRRDRMAERAGWLEATPGTLSPWQLCVLGDAHSVTDRLPAARAAYLAARDAAPADLRPALGLAAVAAAEGDLPAVRALLAGLGSRAEEATPPLLRVLLSNILAGWPVDGEPPEPSSGMEIFIFTHFHRSEKLRRNPRLAAPGLGLIERTVGSMKRHFAPPPGTPVTVLYDHRPGEYAEDYARALRAFCVEEGLKLVVNEGFGLRRQWLDMLARSRADVILPVEHDHEFLSTAPTVAELLNVLARRPDVQHLRLGRRDVVERGYDLVLWQGAPERAAGMCRTATFANSPQLVRRRFLEGVIRPLISGNAASDTVNFGAGGVEATVNSEYRRLEKAIGLPAAMLLFGTFTWGNPGDRQHLEHIGV